MAWERRRRLHRYYYISRRVAGVARKFYIGRGLVGRLAADRTLQRRLDLAEDRRALMAEREVHERVSRLLNELDRVADLLGRASLVATGFQQHARGDWRRRRVAS